MTFSGLFPEPFPGLFLEPIPGLFPEPLPGMFLAPFPVSFPPAGEDTAPFPRLAAAVSSH